MRHSFEWITRSVLAVIVAVLCLTTPRAAHAQNCRKGKPCGDTCIPRTRTCRVGQGSAEWASGADTTSTARRYGLLATPSRADRIPCVIARIVDGDTVWCSDRRKVRLLLIDSPERDQPPFGQAAARALERLIPVGAATELEYDLQRQDRYGRDLAYIHMGDGRIANEEILRAGYAVVSVYQPNVRYVERFRAAAAEAQVARRGLWATSAFDCLPSDHRRGRC